MRLEELNALHVLYRKALKQFEPDLVWFYGGNCFDYLIPDEARRRGLPVAAYLANGNFTSTRWCEDVDLIVTNSEATRALYRKRLGIDCEVMGTFVPPERFVAEAHARTHLTFVNPRLAKGAGIVAQVAMSLERSRPDIPIEVVESRGRWEEVLRSTSRVLGQERETLGNVTVTPHTNDMRQVYGRSRVVLMPSLWWESSGRVVIEAMLNGIPAIVSDHGGMAEMMGEAGAKISFPPPFRKAPYRKLLPTASVEAICDLVIRFFDDREYYEDLARKAEAVARRRHDITRNARDLRHRLQRLAEAGRALRA
jgi:glycosyltransferase involved in cell wall biosynthesis